MRFTPRALAIPRVTFAAVPAGGQPATGLGDLTSALPRVQNRQWAAAK